MSAAQRPFLTASNRCEPPGQTVALDEARSNELETLEPLAKLWCGSAEFVASGDAALAILGDCSGSAWYSAASERFWVTSGKPMAVLPRNGGKPLISCLGANALR